MVIKLTGGHPLKGDVSPKGSVFSALAILACSLLVRERVFLENVPKVSKISSFLESLKAFGISYSWVAKNSLTLDTSGLSNSVVTDPLLLVPVLARFGEATVVLGTISEFDRQFLESLGVSFETVKNSKIQKVLFSKPTILDTNLENHLSKSFNALLLFLGSNSNTTFNNFLMTEEMEELLVFLKSAGLTGDYTQVENCLKMQGGGVLPVTNASFKLGSSALETAFWASAAIISGGDILVKDVSRAKLVSFLAKLTIMGCTFEFDGDNLRVWRDSKKPILPIDIAVSKASLLYDFLPMLVVLMLVADGVSTISGIDLEQEPYFKDLNLFSAKITKNSVLGPSSLRGSRVALPNFTSGLALFLVALGSSTKSEILEAEKVSGFFDDFENNLKKFL